MFRKYKPEQLKMIRGRIKYLQGENNTAESIANTLNKEGFRTSVGGKFTRTSVSWLIREMRNKSAGKNIEKEVAHAFAGTIAAVEDFERAQANKFNERTELLALAARILDKYL